MTAFVIIYVEDTSKKGLVHSKVATSVSVRQALYNCSIREKCRRNAYNNFAIKPKRYSMHLLSTILVVLLMVACKGC